MLENMHFTERELDEEIKNGFVSERFHPRLPLAIYNYTPKCVFDNRWNEVTLSCRGLILDEDYNVVARPFRKFFNLNTDNVPETLECNLPNVAPLVTEKMDGSLGIYWRYLSHEGVATRGSFTSDQAVWATKWLRYNSNVRWPEGTTPLFEIIFPSNRVVVDYGRRSELTLLAIVNNEDGTEVPYDNLRDTGYKHIVRAYKGKSLEACVAESVMDTPVSGEGYVLRYDTSPYPLRIKIKFAEYLRLHRMFFSLNDRVLWEMLVAGQDPLKELDQLPDDAKAWVASKTGRMRGLYEGYKLAAEFVYQHRPPSGTRKEMAEYFKQHDKIKGLCFSLLDGKGINDGLWKMIRPERAEIFREIKSDVE